MHMHCTNIIILKMTPICICQNVQDYFKIVQSYSSSVWPINFTDLFGYLYYLYAYLVFIYVDFQEVWIAVQKYTTHV